MASRRTTPQFAAALTIRRSNAARSTYLPVGCSTTGCQQPNNLLTERLPGAARGEGSGGENALARGQQGQTDTTSLRAGARPRPGARS